MDAPAAGVAMSNLVKTSASLVVGTWMLSMFLNSMTGVERLMEYSDDKDEEPAWDVPSEDRKLGPSWPKQGKIKITNLSLRYREGLPLVLKGLNLTINAGQKVGVVGRTGSGKSTLMLGLMRILEMDSKAMQEANLGPGGIQIDGADIYKIGLHKLRRGLTIIPQDPYLFKGTLRTNLDPLNQFTDEQIMEGLTTVKFFSTLKPEILASLAQPKREKEGDGDNNIDGYELLEQPLNSENSLTTKQKLNLEIEKAGANLSLGQRQLICIATALINKPKILLMDEATASVDQRTDEIIQDVIMNKMEGTTIITIAHRINTIIGYDKIVVLEQGKKAEEGSPKELMEDGGIFYDMVEKCGTDFLEEVSSRFRN